jgi:hypothetical protein
VLHGDREPPSVFLVTALVLGRWICIVGECLRGCGGTTLFHHPVKRTTWRVEPAAELRPCRGAALLGGDIADTGFASFGLVQPHSARDGNGYPLPETRWVFALLGYGFGSISLPMGLLMGSNGNPMGMWA